jgi:hypothetical protein
VFRSTWALEQAIKRYIATTNADATPFVWTKTADEILESVADTANGPPTHTTKSWFHNLVRGLQDGRYETSCH